jgi:hypothetical protein
VDVAAVVLEDRATARRGQPIPRRVVEVERFRYAICVLCSAILDVDPQKLRAVQPPWPLRKIVEALDLVAIEEDRTAQDVPSLFICRLYPVPASSNALRLRRGNRRS